MSATTPIACSLREWLEVSQPRFAPIAAQQAAARKRFLERGFPTRHDEEWRYTSVEPIAQRAFRDAAQLPLPEQWALPVSPSENACRFLFIDGQLAITPPALPHGVLAQPLAVALRDPHWQQLFAQIATADHSSWVDLNSALLTDGLALSVSGDVTLPIEVVWSWRTGSDEMPIAAHPRLILDLAPGSRLTLVEHYTGETAAAHLMNGVVEIRVGAGAELNHFVIQEAPAAVAQIVTHAVTLGKAARYHGFEIELGGRLARRDLNVTLAEPHGEAILDGLFLIGTRQHHDTHTRLRHDAAQTISRERYRLIAVGKGRGVFKGSVRVAPGAVQSDAQQSCKSLLLAAGAEIDAKPELEIYTDDVRCSHGATVGRLDRDTRFYLLSRGLSPEEAETLLIFALAEEVVEAIPLLEWRRAITERLISRLPDRAILQEQL